MRRVLDDFTLPPDADFDPQAMPPSVRMLNVAEVAGVLGCSPRHVYRLPAKEPTFPQPVEFAGVKRWFEHEIVRWLFMKRSSTTAAQAAAVVRKHGKQQRHQLSARRRSGQNRN